MIYIFQVSGEPPSPTNPSRSRSEYFTFAKQIFHRRAISLARRANFIGAPGAIVRLRRPRRSILTKCYFTPATTHPSRLRLRLAVPPSLTREGWGISLSAESDVILYQRQITNGCFDIYCFTTSLPLSGKVALTANIKFAVSDG